jgi:hypothetical protein
VLDLRTVGVLCGATDAPHVRAESGDAAAGRRIVAVRCRDVPIRERGQRVVRGGGDMRERGVVFGQRALDRLGDQLVTRGEVLVEAAVGWMMNVIQIDSTADVRDRVRPRDGLRGGS